MNKIKTSIPLLLFAIRESIQESLGFSLFTEEKLEDP